MTGDRRAVFVALAWAGCAAAPIRAQSVCDGRPIREVRITTASLFGIEDQPFPPVVQRMANALHWRTRPRIVARDLLFRPGESCDPRRLAETERLLRAQGYVRAAGVTPVAAPGGAVDVEVLTRDDWTIDGSLSFDPGRSDRPLRRFRLAEDNLLGRGMTAQVRYRHVERDPGFDVSVVERHFLRGRRDATFVLGHSGMGAVAEQAIARAFETEFDRVAWREASRYRREAFALASPRFGSVAQPLLTAGVDAGVAVRFGAPGRLLLVGGIVSWERLAVQGAPEAAAPADDAAAAQALQGRWRERRKVRANLLVGARALRFATAAGLDAVNALEDIRTGVEAGLVIGRGLGIGRGLQEDWFGAAELFAGSGLGARSLVFARGKVEGRRVDDAGRWDGVIASAQLMGYAVVTPRSVLAVSLGGAGGWHTSTPFQLQLAGMAGLRGYGHSGRPVGRRVVAQAEQRYFVGTVRGAVDVGTAAFVDVGRGWAADAVFGADTRVLSAVGAGVRLAFPSGSRRVWRLDVTLPLRSGLGPEVRLGFGQAFGISRGEADDVVRSRETVSSATVFNFPRY